MFPGRSDRARGCGRSPDPDQARWRPVSTARSAGVVMRGLPQHKDSSGAAGQRACLQSHQGLRPAWQSARPESFLVPNMILLRTKPTAPLCERCLKLSRIIPAVVAFEYSRGPVALCAKCADIVEQDGGEIR